MDLNQPALLRMADAYFIKVEETPIKLPESIKQLPKAIGYLLMFHYILGTSYPDIVSPVYVCFELLFEMRPSRESRKAKLLFSRVFVRSVE